MKLAPIGVIHSPYQHRDQAPRQGRSSDVTSELELYPTYRSGLAGIETVTHLVVLYWGHLASRDVLQTRTPWSAEPKGVFACRSPNRPNPIALCVAELLEVRADKLLVRGVDAVDGTPLLDLKPYSSKLDSVPQARIGWTPKL